MEKYVSYRVLRKVKITVVTVSMYLKAYIQNLGKKGQVVSEKKKIYFDMYNTLDQNQEMALP